MTGALSPVILVLGFGGGPPRVGAATDAEQAEHVAATAVGLRDEELHVKDVAVRILPQPTEPHGVAATFDLVRVRGGAEVARESWSVSMRFSFLPQIPAELVVRNPTRIVISFLQGDRIVTSGRAGDPAPERSGDGARSARLERPLR